MATKTIKNPDGTYTTYDDASYTPPVAAPSPISVGSLSSTETPAALPDQPQTPDYLSSITSIPGMAELTGAAPTATETKQNDLSSRLEQAYAKLGGQGAAQQSAEQAAGLPGFQSQLTDINNQIQTLQKEAAMIPIALQQDAVGRGITAGGLAPIQADQLRANAIKSLSLSAIAQTIQGNVALAQQQANKAVEAEFGGVQAEIDFLSQALQLNTQALSREDEKKAQSLSIQLQERQRQLDDAKENRNIIIGWAAEASKNGASSYLINQALATKDPSQALQLLGGFFQDPNAKAQALADLNYKRAQTAAVYADIKLTDAQRHKVLAEANPVTEDPKKQLQQNEALTLAKELLDDAAPGKGSAVGASLAKLAVGAQWLGLQGDRTAYEAKVNTLKANLTLDNLKLLKGAMSDKDLLFLNSIGSSLDTNMSEAQFNSELQRIVTKLEEAGATTTDVQVVNGVTYKKGTDGLYYPQ